MTRPFEAEACLERVIALVEEASIQVLDVYRHDFDVTHKADGSPLTEADLRSHEVLTRGLASLIPGTPVISEESAVEPAAPSRAARFWLVDPLDGTKEFVRRTDEFTVNVALVEQDQPYLGVVSAPALGTLYAGIAGVGAFRIDARNRREPISVNTDATHGLRVVGSRSHGDPERMQQYLRGHRIRDFTPVGSSLKFCRIAEGRGDLYPRFGRTMEWDTAAGHAVLLAAGGRVETLDGEPLRYGKPGLDNPHFVARSAAAEQTN